MRKVGRSLLRVTALAAVMLLGFSGCGGKGLESKNSMLLLIGLAGGEIAYPLPQANGLVNAMTRSGDILYVGGEFTSIGGQTRNRIAAVDLSTGTVTSWDPNASNTVCTLVVSGSTVYAGGQFTSIGGQTRNRIAALDATTGNATSWNPNANGAVYTFAVSGSTVYVGGAFSDHRRSYATSTLRNRYYNRRAVLRL